MSVCFFSKKAFSLQIDNYFTLAIFAGNDCLRVSVNIELSHIEQRRFLHNLKWKQPKSPLQIVVLVEGEIEGRVTIASTASEYPLANFEIFRSLARKFKNACWDNPKPLWRTEAAHGKQKTEYPNEILCHRGRKKAHRWADKTDSLPTAFYIILVWQRTKSWNLQFILIVQLAAGNAIIMEQPCYQKGISIISPVLKHNKVIPLCKSER